MTQIATVNRLVGTNQAEVMVRRQSACGHSCESCGGCGPETATKVIVLAVNDLGAQIGDTVRVESESSKVLKLAALLYLLPFVFLFAGYLIASSLFHLSEGASVAVGVACLVAGVAVNFLTDRHLRKERPVQFRITEVLKSCSDM